MDQFLIPAHHFPALTTRLRGEGVAFVDQAQGFEALADLTLASDRVPYNHQREALTAGQQAQRRGVVVLPTAAGKTYVAQLALASVQCSALITVPTLDLMHQWYDQRLQALPGQAVGLLGGGSRDRPPSWWPPTTAPPSTPNPWEIADL